MLLFVKTQYRGLKITLAAMYDSELKDYEETNVKLGWVNAGAINLDSTFKFSPT